MTTPAIPPEWLPLLGYHFDSDYYGGSRELVDRIAASVRAFPGADDDKITDISNPGEYDDDPLDDDSDCCMNYLWEYMDYWDEVAQQLESYANELCPEGLVFDNDPDGGGYGLWPTAYGHGYTQTELRVMLEYMEYFGID